MALNSIVVRKQTQSNEVRAAQSMFVDGLQPSSDGLQRWPPPSKEITHFPNFSSKNSRTLLGAKGIATRSKNATRGSWPYY